MGNLYVTVNGEDPVTKKAGLYTFSIKPDVDGQGLLLAPLYFETKVSTWIQSTLTSSNVSDIRLCNADGRLDNIVDSFNGLVQVYDVTGYLASGELERAYGEGKTVVILKLKDPLSVLDKPVQEEVFPASETSITGIGTVNFTALEAQPRPWFLGKPQSCSPVLTNPATSEYNFTEGTYDTVRLIYDRMVDISANMTEYDKGFTLSLRPDSPLLVYPSDDKSMQTPGGTCQNFDDQIEYLMDAADVTNYSQSDADDMFTDRGHRFAYYQDNTFNITYRALIQWMCDSQTAWFYGDANGNIRFGYLTEPAVSADVDILAIDVIDGFNRFDDTAPNLTSLCGSNKNFTVLTEDQVAPGATDTNESAAISGWRAVYEGTGSFDSFYTDKKTTRDTLLRRNADDEADNVMTLYSERRRFYTFRTDIKVDIGQTVNFTYPRYDLTTGKNLLCVGVRIDFINKIYTLTLWG